MTEERLKEVLEAHTKWLIRNIECKRNTPESPREIRIPVKGLEI